MANPQPMDEIGNVMRRIAERQAALFSGLLRHTDPARTQTPVAASEPDELGRLELALARQSRARSALLGELRHLVDEWTRRAGDPARKIGSESYHLGASAAWSMSAEQLATVLLNNRPGGEPGGVDACDH